MSKLKLAKRYWLTCLALSVAGSAFAQPPAPPACPERALQEWLSLCANRLMDRQSRAAQAAPPPGQTPDSWAALVTSDVLVQSGPALPERIVEECRVGTEESAEAGEPVACDATARREWLKGCVADASALVGKTRAEIPASFGEDGGLSTPSEVRYLLQRCAYLKVTVRFAVAHDEDGREVGSPQDVVTAVEPYLGPWLFD
jgi:hypothetical protein